MINLKQFNQFILEIDQPPYPPYHEGKYLERYFIDFYKKNRNRIDQSGYYFLPICWTDLYLYRSDLLDELQSVLDSLDPNLKYFTLSQHDDAPFQKLPQNTLKFSAGGNQPNCIPIPLICSEIKNIQIKQKDIFCSFVGSVCQSIPGSGKIAYDLRMNMLETLVNKSNYFLKPKHWSAKIENNKQDLFLDVTSRSKFTLCPRGYGATSFRLYEAMQLGSIPVYIYHETPYIPFSDQLDWNKLAILINSNDMSNIDDILNEVSDEKYNEMLEYTQSIYSKYFTLDGMCDNILKYLK